MKAVRVLSFLVALQAITIPAIAGPAASGRVELQQGWRLVQAENVRADGVRISMPSFDGTAWYPIQRMPATVLEVLSEDGVYKDLYFGDHLAKVPQGLALP